MPTLVNFMLRHALIGGAAAILFVAVILLLDIGGLATLIRASSSGALAVALLTFFTALTFGSLQMAIAVMSLKEKDDAGTDGGADAEPILQAVPARIKRRTRRH